MLEFHCPHCEARLKCSERMVGKESNCLKCGERFVVPEQGVTVDRVLSDYGFVEPPPLKDFSAVAPHESAVSEATRTANQRGLGRAMSWKNFFDWRFERYMTPWIIRFTWALSVIWAGCVIVLLAISMVSSALPAREEPRNEFSSQADVEALMRSLNPQQRSAGERWTWKLIGYGTAVVACIFSLLGTRVVLECLIVVFKIAETATSIDQSLKQQLARGDTVGS